MDTTPSKGLPLFSARPLPLPELVRSLRVLPSLAEIRQRGLSVLDAPNPDNALLIRLIEADCGLTARLLRMVNSAAYGVPRRVDRVSHAVALAGPRALRELFLATPVVRAFAGISPRLTDMATFWHHGIHCAEIARRLAKHCGVLHGERLAAAGVLHDIGQLALYQVQPELAARALSLAEASDDGLDRAERRVFGYSHAEVGEKLLEAWRLPENLRAVARHHHQPLGAGEHRLDTAIVHLANSLANRLEPGRHLGRCASRIEPGVAELLGLGEPLCERVLNEASDGFLEVLDVLLSAPKSR